MGNGTDDGKNGRDGLWNGTGQGGGWSSMPTNELFRKKCACYVCAMGMVSKEEFFWAAKQAKAATYMREEE